MELYFYTNYFMRNIENANLQKEALTRNLTSSRLSNFDVNICKMNSQTLGKYVKLKMPLEI